MLKGSLHTRFYGNHLIDRSPPQIRSESVFFRLRVIGAGNPGRHLLVSACPSLEKALFNIDHLSLILSRSEELFNFLFGNEG